MQVSGTLAHLSGVSFVNTNTGWVVGNDLGEGEILHTTDGGATWRRQFSGGPYLSGVSFVNANVGTAVGFSSGGEYSAFFLRTNKGGETWSGHYLRSTGLRAVKCVDPDTCTAVGDGIWHTRDRGITWTRQDSLGLGPFFGVSFVDANIGTVVGTNGDVVILRTNTGGE